MALFFVLMPFLSNGLVAEPVLTKEIVIGTIVNKSQFSLVVRDEYNGVSFSIPAGQTLKIDYKIRNSKKFPYILSRQDRFQLLGSAPSLEEIITKSQFSVFIDLKPCEKCCLNTKKDLYFNLYDLSADIVYPYSGMTEKIKLWSLRNQQIELHVIFYSEETARSLGVSFSQY